MSRPYVRALDLPRVLPISASLLTAPASAVADVLAVALQAEVKRGVAGHWTYCPARHAALKAYYQAERNQADAEADRDAEAYLDRLECARECQFH